MSRPAVTTALARKLRMNAFYQKSGVKAFLNEEMDSRRNHHDTKEA
jgi:hypothetical protein